MDIVPGETRAHRRTMRDLVALTALPAVWAGYRSPQVAEGLADVLLTILRLDLVYLRLPAPTEGQEIEVARTGGRPATPDQTQDVGRALTPWLEAGCADPAPSIPNLAGSGTVRLVVCAYDLTKFGAGVMMDLLRTHPLVIIGGYLQENPFFVPPDEFLRELRERAGQDRTGVG